MMKQFLLIFPSMQELVLEAITINWLIILFIMTYASIFFCTYCKYLESVSYTHLTLPTKRIV